MAFPAFLPDHPSLAWQHLDDQPAACGMSGGPCSSAPAPGTFWGLCRVMPLLRGAGHVTWPVLPFWGLPACQAAGDGC